ncbi:uncharacterized protein LOC131635346 [Vicia villosa]|uniref:uncharacterized protein LOC131635346 n=1 Tax=Vicia villosa TaxID=3911 RepID=UPI00273C8486|nr:uncharacterized protein LOC131635346 [Vicia villosa]
MSEEKLVRKTLRFLLRKFDMKVTAIEEVHDISTMRVDELVGSLQIFELANRDKFEKKNKSIAFISNAEDEKGQANMDTDEGLSNTIVLLGKIKESSAHDTSEAMDVDNLKTNTRNPKNPNTAKNIETSHKDIARGKITLDHALDVLTSKKDTELNIPQPGLEVAAETGEKEDVDQNIVNTNECISDDEIILKKLSPGLAKRLRNKEDKATENTLSKISREALLWDELRFGAKFYILQKNNEKSVINMSLTNILDIPLDNVSFHHPKTAKNGSISIINCYEKLVKEFVVNITQECSDKKSKEFRKAFVRGKCVEISPPVMNKFLGRSEEEQPEVEVSDNTNCREITEKQVKEWPRKDKLSAS